MIHYARFTTSLGRVFATAREGAVTGVYFEGQRHAPAIDPSWVEEPTDAALLECARQLCDYLDGRRRGFDLPLAPEGTPFQRRVWDELRRIPFGETISYSELARRLGDPKLVRAVGVANGRNPISIVIPCHRVIGADGSLVGYGGGLERKRWLLQHEGILLKM